MMLLVKAAKEESMCREKMMTSRLQIKRLRGHETLSVGM